VQIRHLTISLLLTSALTASGALADNASQFTPAQTQQIEQITHNYLVKNPQVLVEASQALQQQQMQQMEKAATKGISANAKDLFNNPASPVVGNPNGTATVVEFFDYQCPHCKDMAPILDTLVKQDPQLRVVYKELPIFGETSEYAAKAALAAQKQGKYIEFHNALMKDTNALSKDEVLKDAKAIGLNVDQLTKDMNDPTIAAQLKDNYALAKSLELVGTPAFIVGNRDGSKTEFVPGTTTEQNLEQLIAKVRK
jgi:protein-disulfide isomerase